jgi:hypothetical protein
MSEYRCTRCGNSEVDAREYGCAASPCPMELVPQRVTLRMWLRWHEGELVILFFAAAIVMGLFL